MSKNDTHNACAIAGIAIYAGIEQRDLIDRAAAVQGTDIATFIVDAAYAKAVSVLCATASHLPADHPSMLPQAAADAAAAPDTTGFDRLTAVKPPWDSES